MVHETLMEAAVDVFIHALLGVEALIVLYLQDAASLDLGATFEELNIGAARSHLPLELIHEQAAVVEDHRVVCLILRR